MNRPKKTTTALPPLESGDRLTRSAFEKRYAAMPHVKKAELVNGTVYVPWQTGRFSFGHARAHAIGWLGTYAAATPYIMLCDNTTVRLDPDNEIQPDALLRIGAKSGGASRLSKDDYIEGAPELIVEIAASSAAYDLYDKKTVCRRHGVKEYVVWQMFESRLDWFVLEDDDYLRLDPDADGLLRSQAFPGLRLPVPALLEGDLAAVLDAVRQGTTTEAHAAFAETLRPERK